MKLLELFAGTRSVGKAFERAGWKVWSVDWDASLPGIDESIDIETLDAEHVLEVFGRPDVVWASPDCTTYSMVAAHRHRDRNLKPVSDYAVKCDRINYHVMRLIRDLEPHVFFIENPRGGYKSMPFCRGLPCFTATYCQYGFTRMKPTNIFTNCPGFAPQSCKNGDPCHERAPRGAKTGTCGVKGHRERGVIPDLLCDYVAECASKAMALETYPIQTYMEWLNETHKRT